MQRYVSRKQRLIETLILTPPVVSWVIFACWLLILLYDCDNITNGAKVSSIILLGALVAASLVIYVYNLVKLFRRKDRIDEETKEQDPKNMGGT